MKSAAILASVLLIFAIGVTARVARADDGRATCAPCKSWCPDDYQCKPLPKCPPIPCGLTDDYQCKPLPKCPCVPAYLGCDDYQCKPLPKCPSICFPFWYSCGPAQTACATTQVVSKHK